LKGEKITSLIGVMYKEEEDGSFCKKLYKKEEERLNSDEV
jgi:hypothetical protein